MNREHRLHVKRFSLNLNDEYKKIGNTILKSINLI